MTTSVAIYLTSMTTGGAERVALNLCKGLTQHGYDVDLVLVNATGDLLEEVPTNVSVVDLEAGRVAKSISPLLKYLSNECPDILYSMMTEPNILAILAKKLSSTNTKLFISEHNMISHSTRSIKDRLIKIGAWSLYPLADHAIAVSKGVRQDVIENTRLRPNEVTLVYNPVDIKSIQNMGNSPVDHNWIIDDDIEVILAGGRHEPQKGFDILLSAFKNIDRNNTRLIIFGTGPETQSLMQQATSLGIEDRVWFPGFVENPYKLMQNADVFVLSSQYEGFGLVLIEALACGCPIVSTDCESGPAEILNEGEFGRLVPVGDDSALASSIEEVLENPQNKTKLINRAFNYDIDVATSKYVQLFERYLESDSRRPV